MASEEANVELLHLLLDQPSSLCLVNEKTFSGNTALHIISCLQNHSNQLLAVRMLMSSGADPSVKNCEMEAPAHLLSEGPDSATVQKILKGKSF